MTILLGEYGLLLRTYAKEEKDVDSVVKRAVKNIQLALDTNCFTEFLIAVPVDYDCGKTAKAIRKAMEGLPYNPEVREIEGHHSCEVLNDAIERLFYRSAKIAIISGKAMQYVTPRTMFAADNAFHDGALVVGVATAELEEFVLSGRVQNTFAIWDANSIYMNTFKTKLGVEEIDPSINLVKKYGKCIAILDPKEKPALNIRKSADGIARHKEVMETKLKNQQIEVTRLGVDFDFIKNGIMDGYPKKV